MLCQREEDSVISINIINMTMMMIIYHHQHDDDGHHHDNHQYHHHDNAGVSEVLIWREDVVAEKRGGARKPQEAQAGMRSILNMIVAMVMMMTIMRNLREVA